MGNEKYFNENVVAYDKYRPTYVNEVFEDIIVYSNISKDSNIIEIGCGTGNATAPFLNTGARITAIELGKQLSAFMRCKYSKFSNLTVENMRFEDYICPGEVDLIYSATAFHWIPDSYGYPKCKQLLKNDGVLAVFWNTPRISKENPELNIAINNLYRIYLPETSTQSYEERCMGIQWIFKDYGYRDMYFKLYKDYRTFDADSYIGLLHTYSNHMALPQDIREEFFGKIHDEISKHCLIEIEDTIDLHMGRK